MAIKRIMDHFLVPKHEIIPDERLDELAAKFGELANFPKIDLEDPVVKEIGGKKGDVIRITRRSPTAIEAVYFRIVV